MEVSQEEKMGKDDKNRGSADNTYDYRLIFETAWFILINSVTAYVFLYKGFEWPQEPGRIQRFMW